MKDTTYKGFIINHDGWGYTYYHPEHQDRSFEDGRWINFASGGETTMEDVRIDIDEFYSENPQIEIKLPY